MSAHNQIFRDIRRAGNTGGQPVLRHMGQAQAADLTRSGPSPSAPEPALPGGNGPHTWMASKAHFVRCPPQRQCPRPRERAPERRHPVRQVGPGDPGPPFSTETRLAGFSPPWGRSMHHLPAYHHGGQLAFRHLPCLRKAHQLPWRITPTRWEMAMTSSELVGNEDDGHALPPGP